MKIFAWICLALVILCIVALVVYMIVGAILCHVVLSRKSVAERVMRKDLQQRINDNKIDLCWWEKQKMEVWKTKSFDGLTLVGRYLDNNSDKTVIVVHGFGGSFLEMQPYCKFFFQKNFNVLAVDNRAHGESEGNCIGLGWLDRFDVKTWVQEVCKKTPEAKIVLFGVSMGGTAVLSCLGEKGLKNVVAAISDCAFANADKQIAHIMRNHKFALKLFRKWLYSYVKRVQNFDITKADACRQLANCQVPVLLIHGSDDNFVPTSNVDVLYNSLPGSLREKYVVEGAVHPTSYAVAGVMYEKKINDFLAKRTAI